MKYSRYKQQIISGLAEVVREKRLILGLSQVELALAVECGRNYITGLESKRVSTINLERLIKLAMALNLPLWSLLKQAEKAGEPPIHQ